MLDLAFAPLGNEAAKQVQVGTAINHRERVACFDLASGRFLKRWRLTRASRGAEGRPRSAFRIGRPGPNPGFGMQLRLAGLLGHSAVSSPSVGFSGSAFG